MNQLFLLKLIFDLLEDKPTKYKIDCAKKILKGMIDEYSGVPSGLPNNDVPVNANLDLEAQQAQRELLQ